MWKGNSYKLNYDLHLYTIVEYNAGMNIFTMVFGNNVYEFELLTYRNPYLKSPFENKSVNFNSIFTFKYHCF